jgi:hypothetical protein
MVPSRLQPRFSLQLCPDRLPKCGAGGPCASCSGAGCERQSAVSLHSQRALVASGTLRAKRELLSPVFSVSSWTSSALSRLLGPSWSWRTFLVGAGMCPLCSAFYLLSPAPYLCSLSLYLVSACAMNGLLLCRIWSLQTWSYLLGWFVCCG